MFDSKWSRSWVVVVQLASSTFINMVGFQGRTLEMLRSIYWRGF